MVKAFQLLRLQRELAPALFAVTFVSTGVIVAFGAVVVVRLFGIADTDAASYIVVALTLALPAPIQAAVVRWDAGPLTDDPFPPVVNYRTERLEIRRLERGDAAAI